MGREIKTETDFARFVQEIEAREGYRRPDAFAIGIAHLSEAGTILDTLFPFPNFHANYGSAAVLADAVGHLAGTASYPLSYTHLSKILSRFAPFEGDGKSHPNIDAVKDAIDICAAFEGKPPGKVAVVAFVDTSGYDPGPRTVPDAYLRLHLLSHRLVKPNSINLDSIFGVLLNNVWTNEGPIAPEDLPKRRLAAMARRQPLHVYSVDKFPQMLDYVVPTGIRIADGARVRLGAYLSEGTTVMQEGFCNFNAGTLGACMVEGRISAGVEVGDQTDVGGGASIMGVLSGGGKIKIKIGRGCLIGANAGVGISLGDLCIVEAGLYITAGMPVWYKDEFIKARKLSGRDGLTFRRDGRSGIIWALDKPNKVVLNELLHKN